MPIPTRRPRAPTRQQRLVAAVTAALLVVLAGCGLVGDSGSADRSRDTADVAFAAGMVPHHEQALRMARMTRGRDLSPEFAALVEGIVRAQRPEIATMRSWLRDWGRPATYGHMGYGQMRDRADDLPMGGDDGRYWTYGMFGMMSGARLGHLGRIPGRYFEPMWLRMMIVHHRGAIAMARQEIAHGKYPAAIALARHIEKTQRAEIVRMRAMLAS